MTDTPKVVWSDDGQLAVAHPDPHLVIELVARFDDATWDASWEVTLGGDPLDAGAGTIHVDLLPGARDGYMGLPGYLIEKAKGMAEDRWDEFWGHERRYVAEYMNDTASCPACGFPIDYCQGHGEIGDPAGYDVLQRHDSGDHSWCVPDLAECGAEPTDWRPGPSGALHDHPDIESARHELCYGCVAASRGEPHRFAVTSIPETELRALYGDR